MLQPNGPSSQENHSPPPREHNQCPACGCLTRQRQCSECGYYGVPGTPFGGFVPRPLKVFWLQRKDEAGEFQNRRIIMDADEAGVDRQARENFGVGEEEEINIIDLGPLQKVKVEQIVEVNRALAAQEIEEAEAHEALEHGDEAGQ